MFENYIMLQQPGKNLSTLENDHNQGRGDVRINTLLKCPRTLEVLWTEYQFGFNLKKAAKFFNACERGKVKFSYSHRKPFLTLVGRMIPMPHLLKR